MQKNKHAEAAAAIKAQQLRVFESMNDALKAKVQKILDWFEEDNHKTIMGRWELGKEVQEIMDDEQRNNAQKYGASSMARISPFFKEDISFLRQAAQIYRTFKEDQLREVCSLKMSDGRTHLSFSHIRHLLSLKTREDVTRGIELACRYCWTSGKLGEWVQKKIGTTPQRDAAGRKPGIPRNLNELMTQQRNFAEDLNRRNVKVWQNEKTSLTARVEELTPEEVNEETARSMESLAEECYEAAKALKNRGDEATMNAQRIREKAEENDTAAKPVRSYDHPPRKQVTVGRRDG